MRLFSVGILTISDRVANREREDLSGKEIALMISETEGFEVIRQECVPDEEEEISKKLCEFVDEILLDLVITTGGTGVSPRDRTPEATLAVIHQEIPGMAEAMRAEGLKSTPHAMLSRGVVGIRNKSLIVNLPGSPKAARENLKVILPAIPHALLKIKGDPSECGT
jgi:molybdenum cofactor synthesis domain-containing protein